MTAFRARSKRERERERIMFILARLIIRGIRLKEFFVEGNPCLNVKHPERVAYDNEIIMTTRDKDVIDRLY